MIDSAERDRQVQRIILVEGAANLIVLIGKLVVGISTGSLAVLGDAIHSLTDVTNNAVAWFVVRISGQPADREHPYGHRKFETLAVFGLATLLAVLALELALHALRRESVEVGEDAWALAIMLSVLAANVVIASWQRYWARRLRSDILLADANHTFADVLTTIVVISGWQLSAKGYPWLDTICALGVAALVMYLAYGLFRRALPTLVDQFAVEPETLSSVVTGVAGVRGVSRIRSRWVGANPTIDMVISVDRNLSTTKAHEIADIVEKLLEERFQARDITIHIEPHS
ncbi:MAG: cation diffusion facilitator family transporter [Gammaproteobacteria bacterium]|nr:cation diffusion facilitator family transporter [Gammaproteobacteria bacterium]MDH3468512.1 cation diffusion facilitator family transporter [Gammaproteobacteria bacterium]